MSERTRTVTWQDPAIVAEVARREGGLEALRGMIEGEVPRPPVCDLIGFRPVAAEEGATEFELTPAEHQYNPTGSVHGGVVATVLDSAMGSAVFTTLPPGTGYSTVELHLNLVRVITKDTPTLRAKARVLHRGRTVRTAEGQLVDADGRIYAHATTTCVVLEPRA